MSDSNAAEPAWARVDTTVPHSARVWDFLLGGKDHFAIDREVGETLLRVFPDFVMVARLQREFLARAVHYLVTEAGIRQFLDIGTGLPTADNTHELAQRLAPESRVVYVDNDPIVLVHARALLTSTPEGATDYLDADVRDPEAILDGAAKTLDLSQPVAVMMLSIAGQVTDDDDPKGLIDRLMGPLAPGSYLALSDGVNTNPALVQAVTTYNQSAANTYQLRSPEQVGAFLAGLDLVAPGVVPTPEWHPPLDRWDEPPTVVSAVCGVAKKP
ncbi:SAM-dependent methyltransferase [Nonomuraea glycinis]|uniref:SAM-dependent methyltransferase n=1 Tax=Nonomuraea glycinis TaxID=2047744 RepID=A0A918E4C4_9ACTN|nr:SAM-dependent methyltransferase [Nonomuraea glycinis]MCA2176747.1 SAM-dependent methyltransferase [Nonomuraea glycinis]GGP03390.1 hypothetical protein GCM10012278_14420 [Nonomuraea glycinis]